MASSLLVPPIVHRTPSPASRSQTLPVASAIAGPSRAGSVRLRAEPRRRAPRQPEVDASPLHAEIDRLLAQCDQHELKIRSARLGVEHRLFSEFPQLLARLQELDDTAESLTASVYQTLHATLPASQARLDAMLAARAADVDTLRARTTPWAALLEGAGAGAGEGGIERVEGVAGGGNGDGLASVERWADEVELYLNNEIIRLKALQRAMQWKRMLIWRTITAIAVIALFLVALGTASHLLGSRSMLEP
ncbi:hypothetical protein Q5752_002761 [Cryptotrichosporon argae]